MNEYSLCAHSMVGHDGEREKYFTSNRRCFSLLAISTFLRFSIAFFSCLRVCVWERAFVYIWTLVCLRERNRTQEWEQMCTENAKDIQGKCEHESRRSALQCAAVCHVWELRVAVVRCNVLQCVAVNLAWEFWFIAVRCSALQCVAVRCSVLQCVAVRCSALQCVAVRWSALKGVALCCSVSH